MLSIYHLSKTYPGGKIGVQDLTLEVKAGEIYGFIGHNGAGKTTTIKAIVGLHKFDEGSVTIDGVSILDDPLRAKSLTAYIPDNPELYDNLTGMQFLNFVADIFRVSKSDRQARIEKYANELEIVSALNDQISSYSHGMKQKLAIIAAFVHEPKLLIMDEPFVGLDPKAAFIVKNMMREFCDKGNAIFFSTHVLEVAEKLCDKIAIIKGGRLIAAGTMEEVKGNASLEEVFLEVTEEAH
ncbi:MAG: ABC transporter ATP-binding protein [Clostridiales bacterium]|nr:ABC transporter ATP-binding protein [Candidatus Scatonaster coprocaballi]